MKTLFTLALFFSLVHGTIAQESLTGPHGGRMKVVARGFRIEALGCDNYIEIYIFNEAIEPLFNNGMSGTVQFFFNTKTLSVTLIKYGIDGFTGKISSPDFSHYKVDMLLLDNLNITADFNECVVPKQ